MPHVPPRAPSRGEDDNDATEFKTLLLNEKTNIIPDRGIFGEPTMEPTPAIFHRAQDYPSSLSDTSEASGSSRSSLDDDELESPTDVAPAAVMEDREAVINVDDVDDDEFFDCLGGCDIEAESSGLGLAIEGKPCGAIAIMISYVFVGKPKMVDISHSPRSSNDSRRWGLPPSAQPLIIPVIPSPQTEQSGGDSETLSLAPERPSTAPLLTETEPLFLAQPYTSTTTTTIYSPNSPTGKSSWRGLVRSVSRRKKRAPKELAKDAPAEEPETTVPADAKSEKVQWRPRGLILKSPKLARFPRGSTTTITA